MSDISFKAAKTIGRCYKASLINSGLYGNTPHVFLFNERFPNRVFRFRWPKDQFRLFKRVGNY